jgi:glycosyltransferase involved in cell wall biosynthesis
VAVAVRESAAEESAPRVAVVIPAFNRAHLIGSTIESVLAQTFTDWELVVFNDGSTDDTFEVATSYARIDDRITVREGENGGVATARNRGFERTSPGTEYVAFLDSDDIWDPDVLETFVGVLDSHPEYVGVHGLARCIDDAGRPIPGDDLAELSRARCGIHDGRLVACAPDEPTTFGEFVHHNWVVTPGTQLVRRSALARVGGFDPRTDPADDADLVIRLSRLGDFGFVDRTVLQWRKHPDTLTNTSPRWRNAAMRVRAKTLTDPTNTPAQRATMRTVYRRALADSLRQAGSAARDRDAKVAARHALRAAHLYQAYLLANGRLVVRRLSA